MLSACGGNPSFKNIWKLPEEPNRSLTPAQWVKLSRRNYLGEVASERDQRFEGTNLDQTVDYAS